MIVEDMRVVNTSDALKETKKHAGGALSDVFYFFSMQASTSGVQIKQRT